MEHLTEISAKTSLLSVLCLAKLNTIISMQERILIQLGYQTEDEIRERLIEVERENLAHALDHLPQIVRESIDLEQAKQSILNPSEFSK